LKHPLLKRATTWKMPLGAFRCGNPLERKVAFASTWFLWNRPRLNLQRRWFYSHEGGPYRSSARTSESNPLAYIVAFASSCWTTHPGSMPCLSFQLLSSAACCQCSVRWCENLVESRRRTGQSRIRSRTCLAAWFTLCRSGTSFRF